jgi:hypothetical protein
VVVEQIVLFSLTTVGSLVCFWLDPLLKALARKTRSEAIAANPGRAGTAAAAHGDPVLSFGFILACYGGISLLLVTALPGALALDRTCLTFALLCVGGLLCEISSSSSSQMPAAEAGEDAAREREPISPRFSLMLTLLLNLAFALTGSGQGLMQIVPPPPAVNAARAVEMEPIVVVARRTEDSGDHHREAL